jgi:catechol 2,3-dioxygenase-like lactoylglutathione lyase family enzyme
MRISGLDHLVLTVDDIETTCDFYRQVLGMEVITFGDNRKALHFGSQKINLHARGRELDPRAAHALPGSADLCLLCGDSMDQILSHLEESRVAIIEGPVRRTGACGPILSVYFRDPDGNLLEIGTTDPEP